MISLLAQVAVADQARAQARFDAYVALVLKWNRSIKMIAAKDAAEVYGRHVLDSLSVVPHLEGADRVVDVGSGGGFPAVVLAIARPSMTVTALEPIHKKHAFLATVRRELELDNLRPLAERDEDHRARPDFVPYDVATSRATFAVPEWLERGLELIRPGGAVIAMEAREQHDLPADTIRLPYPLGDRQRALLLRRRPIAS